jgi:hypothetical protein
VTAAATVVVGIPLVDIIAATHTVQITNHPTIRVPIAIQSVLGIVVTTTVVITSSIFISIAAYVYVST